MRVRDVAEFVRSLGGEIPPAEQFWRLGDLTALRRDDRGRYYRANYERGILLYALVAKYRPDAILEFGTGRGYGSLCMAWAMEDHQIPGRIYTIDVWPHNRALEWPIDRGHGPHVESLARSQVWPEAAPSKWLKRIEILTGLSGAVMKKWHGPPVELAFIDGGHGYDAVRHDFYTVLDVCAERVGILFDDYAPKEGFGVQHLIDQEVVPYSEAELVYTDRRWPGGERVDVQDPGYGMVWAHLDMASASTSQHRPRTERRRWLHQYRRREVFISVRLGLGRAMRRIGLRS